jgi:hypothetical protein
MGLSKGKGIAKAIPFLLVDLIAFLEVDAQREL